MKTDHQYIKKLTEDFTSESIRTEDPAGLCFATSFPLFIYLGTKQIKSSLRVGRVPMLNTENKIRKVSHFWLQIDGEGTMLDPTIRQFDENEEPIYIGKLTENKVTKKYKLLHYHPEIWFPKTYRDWKTPLDDLSFPRDGVFEQRSIVFTLKLATILHKEIKMMPSPDNFINHYFELYFTPIYIFLHHWQADKKDFVNLKEKLPNDFDDLLSDALCWAEANYK